MVSALDATAEKAKETEVLEQQLKQAEDRALLYEVSLPVGHHGLSEASQTSLLA